MFPQNKPAILAILFLALTPAPNSLRAEEMQIASYYAAKYRGRPTASGERYDPARFTAAHPTLPFGTRVEVRRWSDGRSVVVRVNDRGPGAGRLDLSEAAARALGMIADGTALVTLHPR